MTDRVRTDYVQEKSLEHAAAFASKLREAALADGLEAAVAQMGRRLKDLVGEDAADLQVRETGFLRRRQSVVSGLPGEQPALIKQAFELAPGSYGVAAQGGQAPSCYVLEVTEMRDAAPEDFARSYVFYGPSYLRSKQLVTVLGWLRRLATENPVPKLGPADEREPLQA